MSTLSRLFAVLSPLALVALVNCSSPPSPVGSTGEATTLADGGLCCSSITATTKPSCNIAGDCCSGVCGAGNVCACAALGGFCSTDGDCCGGACNATGATGGVCTK